MKSMPLYAFAAVLFIAFAVPPATAQNQQTNNKKTPMTPQEISDRMEIEALLVRYCYAVDDRNWNTYRDVFTPDAVIDDSAAGGFRGGVEEHVKFMQKALSKIKISGDEATARTHCSCPMVVDLGKGQTQVFLQGLWYRDRLVRTTSGWRLKERVEEGYWNYNVPAGFKF